MREIKFRVWDSWQKKYAFDGFHVIGEVTVFGGVDMVISETREARFAAQGYETSIEAWNDFEIEQYTGLKDKNGKEIYEGDIVIREGNNLAAQFTYGIGPDSKHWPKDGDKYVVVYLESGFTLIPNYNYGGHVAPNVFGNIGQYNFWNGASSSVRIIGNIHESPELLK